MRNVQKDLQGCFGIAVMSVADDPYKGFYNGFSMAERRATTPLLRAARAAGVLGVPSVCSICGIVQSTVAPCCSTGRICSPKSDEWQKGEKALLGGSGAHRHRLTGQL